MRKVKFENRYGQFQAVINETKKQFRQVEKNLVNYLDTHYPQAKVVGIEPLMSGDGMFRVMLDIGVSFDYKPKYQIGEVLEVIGTRGKVKIKITGIYIQRLCNANVEQVLNEGFAITRKDGYRQYCYYDREEKNFYYYRSHHQCLISFLYRTMDVETVLNNPYSVVYEFELIKNV